MMGWEVRGIFSCTNNMKRATTFCSFPPCFWCLGDGMGWEERGVFSCTNNIKRATTFGRFLSLFCREGGEAMGK